MSKKLFGVGFLSDRSKIFSVRQRIGKISSTTNRVRTEVVPPFLRVHAYESFSSVRTHRNVLLFSRLIIVYSKIPYIPKFRRAGANAIRKPKNFKHVFIRFVIHLVFRVFHHFKTHGRLRYSLGINAFNDLNVNVTSLIQNHFFSRKPSYWHNRVYARTRRCVRFRIYPEIISTLHRRHSPHLSTLPFFPRTTTASQDVAR